jgi:hypothetical protein
VSHLQAWAGADPTGGFYAAEQRILLIVGALTAASAAGVVMSLLGKKGG